MSDPDPYQILGVDREASTQQIKDRYRRIVRECHPDLSGSSPERHERIRAVNWAYGILGDSRKKSEFDRKNYSRNSERAARNRGPTGSAYHGGDFSWSRRPEPEDMVNDPFSRIRPRRGGDLTHELSITFLQALEGVLVEAEIAGKTVCARIPPGVDTGSIVRLSGCGAPGLRGGPRGDLYFVVNVQPDERFLRHGDDIFATLPLSREEAEEGVKIEAPAPDGKVLVKVPPNTMDETIFRFRGRGFPSPDGNGRGDYLIKVSVV